jgi:nitrate reductase gamma subunit
MLPNAACMCNWAVRTGEAAVKESGMKVLSALAAVIGVVVLGLAGGYVAPLRVVVGVFIPYAALALFLGGLAYRVVRWALTPVPFRIPTTCGQQRSLPWIRRARLENPSTRLGVVARVALEVLLFRSLFRNTQTELHAGPRFVYSEQKWLWLAALAFHWSFLVIFIRHLRFFLEPVPAWIVKLQAVDGFFQVGVPELCITDVLVVAALGYLLYRRLADSQVRYLSLTNDFFPLLLLLGLALSGVLIRYFARIDTVAVKQFALGFVTFRPVVPPEVGPLFFVHLTLVSTLIAYFPLSKLVHMPGIFLSPTRNLANNNRMKRHINPWDYPVNVHTYQEWEEEFREKLVAAGLPLEGR